MLVEDGVIRGVAAAEEPCPAGARLIDAGRRVLLPGLIDAHTHAAGHVPRVLRGAEEVLPGTAAHFLQAELRGYLRRGVTTIRVTGSQGLAPQEARQAMRYGAFRGPRVLTCGKIISATAPGGRFYGDMYREADGPGEDAAGGARADPGRSGFHQGHDHRCPVQRTGGPRPAPADRGRACGGDRRGAPDGVQGRRACRGAGRMRGGDHGGRGHH